MLTCTVRIVEHLISVPSVEWRGGSVGRRHDVIKSNTTRDGVVIVKTLLFNPLHPSHGALYSCMADIKDKIINLTKNGKEDVHLVVQCKLLHAVLFYTIGWTRLIFECSSIFVFQYLSL